jgi:diguanylate cyclase (GGDEF)-like protein
MRIAAAAIYWVIVPIWLAIICTVGIFYRRHSRSFAAIRLLLAIIGIDAARNLAENLYFGLYFGSQYGFLPAGLVHVLGRPGLLILPKLFNVAAGCLVLIILLLRWLPAAVTERRDADEHNAALHTFATTDGLTGLFNRRHFLAVVAAEWHRFERYNRPISMLMIDIDHFKSINDVHGHDVGDRVLARVAAICQEHVRTTDILGRLGGEEFGLMLPETSSGDAAILAERLRQSIASMRVDVAGQPVRATVSIGISQAKDGEDSTALLKQADVALYVAKRSGRDRVCHFGEQQAA